MIARTEQARTGRILVLLAAALLLSVMAGLGVWSRSATADNMSMSPLPATTADQSNSGLECLAGGPSFDLWATTGRVDMPDGNSIPMWGYSPASTGQAPTPGPNLCVTEGDTVTVTLHNQLSEDVSAVFPGQEDVQANGSPAQPQFDGSGNLTSLTNVAAADGGTVTYTFTASRPGTYLYESGTSPEKQVQMGLYGALIVRPAEHPDWAYNDPSTAFNPQLEYLMLLHEIDPTLHEAVEAGRAYDATKFHPRYWTINGRAFPDTLAPNNASYLPNQPYGAMVVTQPYDATTNAKPALIRYLNAGVYDHPIHPHGNHVRFFAHDGQVLKGSGGQDLSFERFTQNIGPGQTWDGFFIWKNLENWSPANPIPVQMPGNQNLAFSEEGSLYGGSPYLGEKDDLPVGVTSSNECGEYYFIAHSHAAYEMNNWEGGMGGMTTFFRVDPPNGCQ
jgi:FtsP/CotA-like multicopper oxidase with cupredoxin domain